jgi:hypothetical protein
MKKLILLIAVCVIGLTGCETFRSTVSGPFIGMKKDYMNAKYGMTSQEPADDGAIHPIEEIKKLDEWIQKHAW